MSPHPRFKLVIAFMLLGVLIGCAHAPVVDKFNYDEATDKNLLMILGRYEEDKGNFSKALELYSRIEDPYIWLAKARIYFILEDNSSSLDLLQKVIDDGTYLGEALEMRTSIYAKNGNWKLAIKDTEALIKMYPDKNQIKIFLANLKITIGELKQAQKILMGLIGKGDDSIIYYSISKICMRERDFPCVKDSLKKAIEARPDYNQAYLDLARMEDLLEETAKAEKTYKKLLDIDPYSNEAHMALVDFYIDHKRYDDARAHLKSTIEINQEVLFVRKLTVLDLQDGMFDDALNLIKTIKELSDDDKYYQSLAYAGLERYDEALASIKDIPVTGRLGCDITMLKSSILKSMNKNDQAVAELELAWKDYEDIGTCNEIGYQLATELDAFGRRDEGLKIALKLLEKDPRDAVALNFVGYVWADQGINLDKAYSLIKEALDMKPDDAFIMDSMSWVLFKMGKSKEALVYMEKVISVLKDDSVINEHMADILTSLGQTDRAIDYYLNAAILSKAVNEPVKEKIRKLMSQEDIKVIDPKEGANP